MEEECPQCGDFAPGFYLESCDTCGGTGRVHAPRDETYYEDLETFYKDITEPDEIRGLIEEVNQAKEEEE